MKITSILVTLTVVGCFATAQPATATDPETSVESAYRICHVMDNNFPLSAPCDVSGWSSAVRVSMAISVSEARAVCTTITQAAKEAGLEFDSRWKLEIRSPYSGDNTIATCRFR